LVETTKNHGVLWEPVLLAGRDDDAVRHHFAVALPRVRLAHRQPVPKLHAVYNHTLETETPVTALSSHQKPDNTS